MRLRKGVPSCRKILQCRQHGKPDGVLRLVDVLAGVVLDRWHDAMSQEYLPGFSDPVEEIGEANLIELIERRLPVERSLTGISRATGISLKRLMRVCRYYGVRYPYQQATDEQISAAISSVLVVGRTVRDTAAAVGISKSSVHRFVSRRRKKEIRRAGDFQPKTVPAYRCPQHGMVTLSPCPACAAMGAKKKSGLAL